MKILKNKLRQSLFNFLIGMIVTLTAVLVATSAKKCDIKILIKIDGINLRSHSPPRMGKHVQMRTYNNKTEE